jgi:hypothetical protein
MATHLPESNLNDSTIEAAKTVLKTLSDEELASQQKQLIERANAIPQEMMELAQEHDRLAKDIQNATLLTTLTGEAGSDQSKLDAMAKEVSDQRRQRRIDLERVTTMGKLVDAEINYRTQNRIYRAVMGQIEGWKLDLPDALVDARESLAKVIALYCHVNGGMTPQNILVRDFVPNVLGDVQKRANEVFSAMKTRAVEHFDNGGEQQAQMDEKAAAASLAGREKVKQKHEHLQSRMNPENKSVQEIIRG